MPVMDVLGAPYWGGAAQGELRIQKCSSCESLRFPPALACGDCHSRDFEWVRSAGRGVVWAYCFPRKPLWEFLEDGSALAVVELDEGVRVPTEVTGLSDVEMRIGLPVEVWFKQLADGVALPMFRPS